MKSGKRFARQNFMKLAGISVLGIGIAAYSFLIEPGAFKIETVTLKLPGLSRRFSGLRVAHLSDIHMGGWMNLERFKRVADLVVAEKPDILLITGDFLIGHNHADISKQIVEDLISGLSALASSIPTFAVLGNHDYLTNVEAVRHALKSAGVRNLTNAVFTLKRQEESLHLCGVDDVCEGNPRLDDVIAQLQDNSAAILLAHEPDFADTSAATGRFALQVSGHTHGGQVVIPFLGPPHLPGLGRKYIRGLYKVENMFQYTNRGVGTAMLPARFNCPPEITILVLESASS